MRYHRGTSRYQQTFLSIDDQLSGKNVIRIIDQLCEDYVSQQGRQDFAKGIRETGRKAYHPSDLLKILVYGYFNGISSTRKLERECGRNIELRWLTSGLAPDHKTIADFRRDHPAMIQGLFDYLVAIFQAKGLVSGKRIAVDGSKVKAYASYQVDMTTLTHRLEDLETQLKRYLGEMEQLDTAEDEVEVLQKRREALEQELAQLETKKKRYEAYRAFLEEQQTHRASPTDLEARWMRGRYGQFWGYNIQCAVDTQHHMITSLQTTNQQNDKGWLAPMVAASHQKTATRPEEVLADAGYYKQQELEALEKAGTRCYVAVNLTSRQLKDKTLGLHFTYDAQADHYQCSEGKRLEYSHRKTVNGRPAKLYRGIECGGCPRKSQCTSAEQRTLQRNQYQEWLDAYHKKMESQEGKAKLIERKSVVEHPFGTIKYTMGQLPLLTRGTQQVQTEMNLYAIGYNLKRYFKMIHQQDKDQQNTQTRWAA